MKIECNVAGITFCNGAEEFTTMLPVGNVQFVHDPKNEYDPNAIEVWYQGIRIGYVKMGSYAQEFLKDHPEVCEAKITDFSYAEKVKGDLQFNNEMRGRLCSVSFCIEHGSDPVIMTEDNEYVIAGKRYMRLSNVLKHFDPTPDSPALDKWKMQHGSYESYRRALGIAQRDGTAMHSAVHAYIQYRQDDLLLPDGWQAFLDKYQPVFIEAEEVVTDDDQMIAGQYDAKAMINGVVTTLDWKSNKQALEKNKIQVGWYAAHNGSDEGMVVSFGAENKQRFSVARVPQSRVLQCKAMVGHIKSAVDILKAK